MNAIDARLIGATAVTAATLALLSIVVDDGHVNFTRPGQQTMPVAAGTTQQSDGEEEQGARGVGATVPAGDVDSNAERVVILGLEVTETRDATSSDAPVVAQALTAELRTRAKQGDPYKLAPNGDRDAFEEKRLSNCATEAPECMAAIGVHLGADVLVFGRVVPKPDSFTAELKLLDVHRKRINQFVRANISKQEAEGTYLTQWATVTYDHLVGAKSVCDAAVLKEKALAQIMDGQHAAALALLEASLECRRDPYVEQLAFMEACASQNAEKATLWFKELTPAQQTNFAQICIRTKTPYVDEDD